MPKYLINVDYSAAGAAGLLKDGGSKREKAAGAAIKAAGGRLECFYFAFGSSDAILIAEFPDNVAAAAVSLAVSASGAAALKTTTLLTPREIDAAAKKPVGYQPPGK
jgi:uncharacterized protein with GYD domain